MIKCNLSEIMGQKQLKIVKVSNDTKISRPTLTALYYNTGKGIQFDTMNMLCHYLKVTPAELFDFTPVEIDIDITSFKHNSELDDAEAEFIFFDVTGVLTYISAKEQKTKIELVGRCSAMERQDQLAGVDIHVRTYEYGNCTIGVKNEESLVCLNKAIAELSSGFLVYVESMIKNKIAEHSEQQGIKKIASLTILRELTCEEFFKNV